MYVYANSKVPGQPTSQGTIVQNLMKLLANVTLKFLSRNMVIYWYSLLKNRQCKSFSNVCSKNINVFENTFATTVNMFVINKLVKLTMLWTGPRSWSLLFVCCLFTLKVYVLVYGQTGLSKQCQSDQTLMKVASDLSLLNCLPLSEQVF